MDDSNDSCNFSVRGYLPLIQRDSVTHMHGLEISVKKGLRFAQEFITRKLCVFDWLYFTRCLTSFSSINHLLCPHAWPLMLSHLT